MKTVQRKKTHGLLQLDASNAIKKKIQDKGTFTDLFLFLIFLLSAHTGSLNASQESFKPHSKCITPAWLQSKSLRANLSMKDAPNLVMR